MQLLKANKPQMGQSRRTGFSKMSSFSKSCFICGCASSQTFFESVVSMNCLFSSKYLIDIEIILNVKGIARKCNTLLLLNNRYSSIAVRKAYRLNTELQHFGLQITVKPFKQSALIHTANAYFSEASSFAKSYVKMCAF